MKKPKILLAPMNFANIAMTLLRSLRINGYEADHLQYTFGQDNKFQFDSDKTVNLREHGGRIGGQYHTLAEALECGYDVYHFWARSLIYRIDFNQFSGVDYPIIKSRGAKIAHRFTGYDLRLKSKDLEFNPYSAFRYGQAPPTDEATLERFHDVIRTYADQLLVQDPELLQFCPDAEIIPRAIDLDEWRFVGLANDRNSPRLRVAHVPSNAVWKGTQFVQKAIQDLKDEGLDFEVDLVSGVTHAEAKRRYEAADIIIDGLLVGTTGVSTVEGWALGKCVINYTPEHLFGPFYGRTTLPVVNANPDTIKEQLRAAIKDFDLRQWHAVEGRKLAEDFHDIKKIVPKFTDLYDRLHGLPWRPVEGTGDIPHFLHQAKLDQANVRRINRLQNNSNPAPGSGAAVRQLEVELEVEQRGRRFYETQVSHLLRNDPRGDEKIKNIGLRAERVLDAIRNKQRSRGAVNDGGAAGPATAAPPLLAADLQWAEGLSVTARARASRGVRAYNSIRGFNQNVVSKMDREYALVLSHDIFPLIGVDAVMKQAKATTLWVDLVETYVMGERSGPALRNMHGVSAAFVQEEASYWLRRANRVLVVSEALQSQAVEALGLGSPTLLRNFRRQRDFREKDASGFDGKSVKIAFVNTIAPDYGVFELLDAIRNANGAISARFVGRFMNDAFENEVISKIAEMGIGDLVDVVGPAFGAEMMDRMSDCDIGLNLLDPTIGNLQVSLPNRFGDFLAAGLPVMTSDTGDTAKLVEASGCGCVVDYSSAGVLGGVSKLKSAYADYIEKVATVRENLCWERDADAILQDIQGRDLDGKSVLILARKDITLNNRLRRVIDLFLEGGARVDIYCTKYGSLLEEFDGDKVRAISVGR